MENKSTVKEPLRFFQWLSMEENFRRYKKSYFDEILDNYQVLDFKKDEISYWNDDNNEVDSVIDDFGSELHKVFKREFINAKSNLNDAIYRRLLNGNAASIFLSDIQETLKGIRSKTGKILNYYPHHTEKATNLIVCDYKFINKTFTELNNYIVAIQSFVGSKQNNLRR